MTLDSRHLLAFVTWPSGVRVLDAVHDTEDGPLSVHCFVGPRQPIFFRTCSRMEPDPGQTARSIPGNTGSKSRQLGKSTGSIRHWHLAFQEVQLVADNVMTSPLVVGLGPTVGRLQRRPASGRIGSRLMAWIGMRHDYASSDNSHHPISEIVDRFKWSAARSAAAPARSSALRARSLAIHLRHLARPRTKSPHRLPSAARFPSTLNCYISGTAKVIRSCIIRQLEVNSQQLLFLPVR